MSWYTYRWFPWANKADGRITWSRVIRKRGRWPSGQILSRIRMSRLLGYTTQRRLRPWSRHLFLRGDTSPLTFASATCLVAKSSVCRYVLARNHGAKRPNLHAVAYLRARNWHVSPPLGIFTSHRDPPLSPPPSFRFVETSNKEWRLWRDAITTACLSLSFSG